MIDYQMVGRQLNEYLEQIHKASGPPEDILNPATQAAYLCKVIELNPDAFKEYQKTEHYRKSKAILATSKVEGLTTSTIKQMCDAILSLSPAYQLAMRVAADNEQQYEGWLDIGKKLLQEGPRVP